MKPNRFLFAIAMCGVALADDSVLMSGSAVQNGVSFSFETRLEPPTPPFASHFVGGTVTDPAGIHRYMAYESQHKFFGYDLQVEQALMTDLVLRGRQNTNYRVTFRPLSIDPARVKLDDPDSWKIVELPAIPAPQTIRGGDTIAVDLFTNPITGQKIVDYLHFRRPNTADARYQIAFGDVIFIEVPGHPDIGGSEEVGRDGFISVHTAGQVKAAGLTTSQLSERIAELLSRHFDRPEVKIQIVHNLINKIYVSGEVRRPGSYPLPRPKTVLEAIIEAGGPADFAKTKKIYILRGEQKILFDYQDVRRGQHLEQNILLQNGDVIVVP